MNIKVDGYKTPIYKPTDEQTLTTYTKMIPLEPSGKPPKDPRKKPASKPSIYKLKLKPIDVTSSSHTSYSIENYDIPTLREEPVDIPLESTQPLWDPREKSMMDLLCSDMSPDEILKELNLDVKKEPKKKSHNTVIPDITSDKLYQEFEQIFERHNQIQIQEDQLMKDYSQFDQMLDEQVFIEPATDELKEIFKGTKPEVEATINNSDTDFITLSIDELSTEETWLTLDSLGLTTPVEDLQPPIDFLNI
jgi:hypothetical protein